MPAVDCVVARSGRGRRWTYLAPGEGAAPGSLWEVRFGALRTRALVLGPARSGARRLRELEQPLGHVDAADLDAAARLARRHLVGVEAVAHGLIPNADPDTGVTDPAVALAGDADPLPVTGDTYLLCAPLVDLATVAARAAAALARRGAVLVLVPTHGHLDALAGRFAAGAVRLDARAAVGGRHAFRAGRVRVGLATRSGAWEHAPRLGGIVVVDDDHPGHRDRHSPYLHQLEIAAERLAGGRGRLVVIGTTCPPSHLRPGMRVVTVGGPADWPAVTVFDRSTEPPGERVVPGPVRSKVARAVRAGRSVGVVVDERLRRCCGRCGARREPIGPCARCGDTTAGRRCGFDAETARRAFGDGPRMGSLWRLGTTGPSLVVMDLDGQRGRAELVAGAAVRRALVRAARVAGRGGELVIMTAAPDDPDLSAFVAHDLRAPVRRAAAQARARQLPPFGHVVRLWVGREAAPRVTGWPGRVHGPRRRAGEWELVVLADDDELAALEPIVARLRRVGKLRVRVE